MNKEPRYYYNFAEIELDTRMCVGVHTGTNDQTSEVMIPIPVYDEEYAFKYYINGNWYEDPEGKIPWKSALLP